MCHPISILAILISFLFLNGCSNFVRIEPNQPLNTQNLNNEGIMTFTFTQSGDDTVPYELYHRGIDDHNKNNRGFIFFGQNLDWSETSEAGLSNSGRLFTYKMPAGRYEFYSLHIEELYRNATWTTGKSFSIIFSIEENTINYIGDIHVLGNTSAYSEYEKDAQIEIRNNLPRDQELFNKKHPATGDKKHRLFKVKLAEHQNNKETIRYNGIEKSIFD